jgi:hypothetical protein
MRAARIFKNKAQPLENFLEQMFKNARGNDVKATSTMICRFTALS